MWVYTQSKLPAILTSQQIHDNTSKMVVKIMHSWFNIPSTTRVASCTNFVHILVMSLGPGSLLLPQVWEIYTSMPSWLYNATVEASDTGQCTMHGFEQSLSQLPSTCARMEEYELLFQLKEWYRHLVQTLHN